MIKDRQLSTSSVMPLIVITGPTASGKSALAIELAKKYGGEIICADSRTVYTGMNIGTAKPSKLDQQTVRHHLLDVVTPDQKFNTADFQRLAFQAINGIRSRNKIPFLVGGTGLYIDSVVLNYTFPKHSDEKNLQDERERLSEFTVDELQEMIKKQHLKMPYNLKNKLHLIGVLVSNGQEVTRKKQPDDTTHVVSITTDKIELFDRIEKRAGDMFSQGVVEEAEMLARLYGWYVPAMSGNIYPILRRYLQHEITRQTAIDEFIASDKRLVKKQLTWIRRNEFVHNLTLFQAREYIEHILTSP